MTLVGVLVALFISLLIVSMALKFLVDEVKFVKDNQEKVEVLNRSNLNLLTLKVDLKKAGYGFETGKDNCNGHSEPIYWDSSNKTLGLCFVDYDEPGCEGKEFESGDDCSYRIEYKLDDGELQRCVDEEADGSMECHSLLGDQVVVSDFVFERNGSVLTYKVELNFRGKNLTYKDSCVNLNLEKNDE